MRQMGMDATGTIVLHRASGKEFGVCHAHMEELDLDPSTVAVIGPLFADRAEWDCIAC